MNCVPRRLTRSLFVLVVAVALVAAPLARAENPPVSPIMTPDDARTHGLESLRLALKGSGVPLPPDLHKYVVDRAAAEVLGKALFWDTAVGSDGVQSCASCHFHAGADSRSQNQLNPGTTRVRNQRDGRVRGYHAALAAGDVSFEMVTGTPSGFGPNYNLGPRDFPFVTEPNQWVSGANGVVSPKAPENTNDVAASAGVFLSDFVAVTPGASVDKSEAQDDLVFAVGGATVRRVEPRNTPTTINAALNFSNFWDGRANNAFNGRNIWGVQDPTATVYVTSRGKLSKKKLSLRDASLASQASGPPLSFFEMSAGDGGGNVRPWEDIGAKLLPRRALADQAIDPTDSVLARFARHASGRGLNVTYQALIERAFDKAYWSHPSAIVLNGKPYSQAAANFSFFFGVSVMLYEATLISDQAPFDAWMETGLTSKGFGQRELDGLNVFVGQGRCVNCHRGPEFTNASVGSVRAGAIEAMRMGDREQAVYDASFYNIGVTLTTDDLGRGGKDLNGRPIAFSRQALFQRLGIQKIGFPVTGNDTIPALSEEGLPVCNDTNLDGVCNRNEPLLPAFQRAAVDGAFKVPTLRNVELTGPYFHNGGVATLRQVVQFYDRGGNFCRFNLPDLDPDIQRLGLSDAQEEALVAFMVALTDERVRRNAQPFDRPELRIPSGYSGDYVSLTSVQSVDGVLQGRDQVLVLPATGKAGGEPIRTFLGLDPGSDLGMEPVADGCGLEEQFVAP